MITKKRLILSFIIFVLMLVTFSFSVHAETVADGTVYYSSSWGGGSGNSNVVSAKNPYITEERTVIVNGYSFLDEKGSVIASAYEPLSKGLEVPYEAPTGTVKTMVHIHSLTNRLGWIDSESIISDKPTTQEQDEVKVEETETKPEPEPQTEVNAGVTPEEFVSKISQKTGKTLIYIDTSASMSEFVKDATRAFNELELAENLDYKIISFSYASIEVEREDIEKLLFNGGRTNMYKALNNATTYMSDVEHIVLISDLYDNSLFSRLKKISTLKTVEILCPDEAYSNMDYEYIQKRWKNVEITLSIIE